MATGALVLLSSLSPFPLFFTLGPSQGPDTLMSPWWWHVELKNSEKAILGCWMAGLHECFPPVPCSQRPHLSSMMQDRAASGTDLYPRLLPSSLLIWMREEPGHRQTSGSLVSSKQAEEARESSGDRQAVRAPLKTLNSLRTKKI